MLEGGALVAAGVAARLDDQVRSAATLASITLAILTFFTTRRAQKLAEDRESGLGGLTGAALVALACDLLLASATFGALAAMVHLFRDSFSITHWADSDHVVESLFSIAYLGFAVLFVSQLGLVGYRLVVALRNQLASR
jgi:hypothetical protein